MPLAPGFRPALRFAVVEQLVFLFLTSLILDSGQTLRACVVAVLGYWAATFLIMMRRSASPSRADLAFVRHGTLAMLLLVGLAAPFVWKLKTGA